MSVETTSRAAIADDLFPHIAWDALMRVPYALASRYNVLAYRSEGGELHVLVGDIDDDEVLERVRRASGMRVVATPAPIEALRAKISIAYSKESSYIDGAEMPPAIRTVDELHAVAIASGASDVHVEPSDGGGRIRQRVDGILHHTVSLTEELLAQIVSRIKLLAGMDIAERRQPQDGRYHTEVGGKSIDARVSSMPTILGEKLVIRLLDMHARVPTLEDLGMPAEILTAYRALVHAPYGFVVVCGPTGCGKTTSLYASMSERNHGDAHLCTVEDPVEVRMPGVAQVQVNERAGLTFAAALRSFLRQDPNVVMVGEMRDSETAKVAISAALSGQLVMTTLHASDAPRAVERLRELGLGGHAIAAVLSGVLAQRLVRRLCVSCRIIQPLSSADREFLGLERGAVAFGAAGCAECHGNGYAGRTAVFELMTITDDLRSAIVAHSSSVIIREVARRDGYAPMLTQARRYVRDGVTSVAELRRVLTAAAFA